jgi:hypothetical protein
MGINTARIQKIADRIPVLVLDTSRAKGILFPLLVRFLVNLLVDVPKLIKMSLVAIIGI